MRRRGCLLAVLLLLLCDLHAQAQGKNSRLIFSFQGQARTVYYYVPEGVNEVPIVVLLHGSGRDGTEMLEAWRKLAASEHFALAAPDALHSQAWDSLYDPPAFLHAVVDQIRTIRPLDSQRIYLFGHSGGAVYALALALIDSRYYAATAVHAGALSATYDHLFTYASRKMPVAIWAGDRDPFFPLDQVEATKKLFVSHGFAIQLNVVPKHGHEYGPVAEEVNREAWHYFSQNALPSVTLPLGRE